MRKPAVNIVSIGLMCGAVTGVGGCGAIGSSCGGAITTPCAPGLFCQIAEGACGDEAAVGVCSAKPEVCAEVYSPVCGCDGTTYGNDCEAAGAGVNIDYRGACGTDGSGICGGIAGFQCADGEYCRFDGGTCGATDQSGTCQAIPEACTEIYAPVCGCDDQTYGNECEAARASVSVKSNGACP